MKGALSGAGAVAAGLLAHVPCCGINLALLAGVAGSGTTFLSGLTPYRPWFLGFSLLMACITIWMAFRPHASAACGSCCHGEDHAKKSRMRKAGAVAVAVVALGSLLVPAPAHVHGAGEESGHSEVAHRK